MTAIDLASEEAGGEGVPLLLLHDLAGDRELWRPLIPLLAPQPRVIAADLRGHGESPAPPLTDGYDAGTLAEDCRAGRACSARSCGPRRSTPSSTKQSSTMRPHSR